MKYTGEKCFQCGSQFDDKDDVVVCPECGTPFHRECYKEAGHCTNELLHSSGESWVSEKDAHIKSVSAAESVRTDTLCPVCHTRNSIDAEVCSGCGSPLRNEQSNPYQGAAPFGTIDPTKEYLGFNPEEDFGGANLKEVAQFVDSNTLYYIPLFKRMKDMGTKLSFNLICLFFPQFFFANRKMWFWAIFTAILSACLNVPEFIYLLGNQTTSIPFMENAASVIISNEDFILAVSDVCGTIEWLLKLVACLFANWMYLRFSVRSISKVKAHYGGTVSPACLKSKGGVAPINIIFMGIILLVLSFGLNVGVTFLVISFF